MSIAYGRDYPEAPWVGPDGPLDAPEDDTAPTKVHRGQALFAYRLAERCADELMFVHGIGWHHYDGTRWIEDQRGYARRAVLHELKRALSKTLGDNDLRRDVAKCESAAGVLGVLTLAAALEEFAFTVEDLDPDPYLLNCANGTLDLRTMQLHPHDPADRITKVTRAAYRPDSDAATWKRFLGSSLPDAEVRSFLQRYVGIGLAGRVLEHKLCILTGAGRNGKGVFYGAVGHAFGDYAMVAEPDLFMHREHAHPTGEMDLLGRRWVVVSESDQGRRLAEATVKRLTGGDRIKARRMRMDYVEFPASHTAALVTNHLPKVSGDDPALWSRLLVVPFDVVIPADERDPELPQQLEAEADAILTWAVAGWQEYQRAGLAAPAAVTAATESYQAGADAVGRFIEECCIPGPKFVFGNVHERWSGWAHSEGQPAMGKPEFRAALETRGYTIRRGSGNKIFVHGLVLVSDD